MTPADRRIAELIDKWLASIDLHLQYVELSDAAYARAQPWPKHDRPTRWVLEVARQKLIELKQHCETRQAMGDSRFAESLELMAFLANLVGIQNIQRFIPVADPSKEGSTTVLAQTLESPTLVKPVARAKAGLEEVTREMPKLKTASVPKPATAVPKIAATKPVTTPAPPQAQPRSQAKPAPAKAEAPAKNVPVDVRDKIIADAIRLMKWGKPWHELAELIGRIAERPPVAEIRKTLRAHKSDIESKAAKPK